MTTSWPMSRFGIDAGMSAPWTRPRAKPAGRRRRSNCLATRLSAHPMTNARKRIQARRVSRLQRQRAGAETGKVADIKPQHVFDLPCRAITFWGLGSLSGSMYAEMKSAGATVYIMKFETADPRLYARLAAPGSLDERLEHIRLLAATGWNVSSGFIAGLQGQRDDALLRRLKGGSVDSV